MQGLDDPIGTGVLELELAAEDRLHEAITALVVDAQGARMAAGDANGNLLVKDLGSLEDACTWEGHQDFINSLSFSPKGKRLASGSDDGTVIIWSSGPDELHRHNLHAPTRAAFDPSTGLLAATAGKNLFLLKDNQEVYEAGHPVTLEDLTWATDAMAMAVCGQGGIWVHNLKVGDIEEYLFEAPFFSAAILPDAQLVAGGCLDHAVRLFFAGGEKLLHLEGFQCKVTKVEFDPTNGWLLCMSGRDLVAWNCSEGSPEGKEPGYFAVENGFLTALAVSPGGGPYAAGNRQGELGLLAADDEHGLVPLWLGQVNGGVQTLAFDPREDRLFVGTGDGRILHMLFRERDDS